MKGHADRSVCMPHAISVWVLPTRHPGPLHRRWAYTEDKALTPWPQQVPELISATKARPEMTRQSSSQMPGCPDTDLSVRWLGCTAVLANTHPPIGQRYLAAWEEPADPVPSLIGRVLHQGQHVLFCCAVGQAASISFRLKHAAMRQEHRVRYRRHPAYPLPH